MENEEERRQRRNNVNETERGEEEGAGGRDTTKTRSTKGKEEGRRRRRREEKDGRGRRRKSIAEQTPKDQEDDDAKKEEPERTDGTETKTLSEENTKTDEGKVPDESDSDSVASEVEPFVEEKSREVNDFRSQHMYDLAPASGFRSVDVEHEILADRRTSAGPDGFKDPADDASDGLFVDTMIPMTTSNKHALAHRLVREGTKGFDIPTNPMADRGRVTFEVDDTKDALDNLLTFDVVHDSRGGSSSFSSSSSSRDVHLVLKIASIQMLDAEYFCEEDQIATCLREKHSAYAERVRESAVEAKWRALTTKTTELDENDGGGASLSDVVRTFRAWLEEIKDIRRSGGEIYDLWSRLKRVRKKQGFRSTTIRLVAKRVRLFEKERVQSAINAIKNRVDREAAAADPDATTSDALKIWYRHVNDAKLVIRHDRDYAMQLSENTSYTPDTSNSVPAEEVSRRERVRSTKMHVRVAVDDVEIATLPPCSLTWPDYTICIDRTLRFAVLRRPRSVRVDVCRRGYIGRSVVVGSIVLTPPGSDGNDAERVLTAPALAPVVGSFCFAAREPMRRASSDTVLQIEERKWNVQRHTRGRMDASLFWTIPDVKQGSDAALRADEDTDLLVVPTKMSSNERQSSGAVSFASSRAVDVGRRSAMTEIRKILATSVAGDRSSLVDPNDPRAQALLSALEDERARREHSHFSTRSMVPLPRATDAEAPETLRHALLRLRGTNEPFEFRDSVPLLGREIERDPSLMKLVQNDREQRNRQIRDEDPLDMASPENRGQRLSNFIARVQQLVRRTRQMSGKQGAKRLEEVVQEDQLPEFRVDFDFNLFTVEPIRALSAHAEETVPQKHWHPKCEIMCQIVQAINVPVRRDIGRRSRRATSSPDDDDDEAAAATAADRWLDDRVRPFVELKFQSKTRETTCQEGPAPIWNEVQRLSVDVPGVNEVTPRSLISLQDDIVFSLMDEVSYEGHDPYSSRARARLGSTADTESYGNRFLGSFSVPFSVVYMNGGRVSGWFEVDVPPVLLGYAVPEGSDGTVKTSSGGADGAAAAADDDDDDDDDDATNAATSPILSRKTMIEVLISLQPPIAVPPGVFNAPEVDRRAPHNVKIAHRRAIRWYNRLCASKRMQNRIFNPLVPNMQATETLITRYILPQRPPPMPRMSGSSGENDDRRSEVMDTVEQIAAFVSLIPFVNDWHIDQKKEDMWCTSSEFLRLLAGDWEEHAVLLCNYFLWLERSRDSKASVYVALGRAVPQGSCCFVVRIAKPGATPEIWNPTTGQRFAAKDRDAPLKSIHALLGMSDASDEGSTNFWANVQELTAPWNITFNVGDGISWKPLHASSKKRLRSVQAESLPYRVTDTSFVVDTDALIEREVRKALRQWRSRELHLTTDYNHTASRALKPLLQTLEKVRVGLATLDVSTHEAAVKRLSSTYDVFGFPLHATFTDVASIVRRVRETDAHRSVAKGTQFAVATFVQGYANTLCSVWVYIAVLVQRR